MPTIPEVKPLVVAFLLKPWNCVGGSLHVYLDDGNWERCHIQGCREWAEERGDAEGIALCDVLLRMSKTQRIKIQRNCWRWEREARQTSPRLPIVIHVE